MPKLIPINVLDEKKNIPSFTATEALVIAAAISISMTEVGPGLSVNTT